MRTSQSDEVRVLISTNRSTARRLLVCSTTARISSYGAGEKDCLTPSDDGIMSWLKFMHSKYEFALLSATPKDRERTEDGLRKHLCMHMHAVVRCS
jgi:hypothetical protein